MAGEGTNPSDDLSLGQTLRGFVAGQKLFNRYTLQRILGRGGMGVVWLAHDDRLDEEVALKFLPETVTNDPEAIEDLKHETKRSRELNHHYIVRIHDFVQDELVAGISMEYVDGKTVTAMKLKQPARCFNAGDLMGLVAQVCEALEYAHTVARVVHRDLKPSNLMINSKRDLKVTDFGIARSIADTASRASGKVGTSGTLAYMSPQQANGENASPRDDVYALGATLYELLTSKPPFYSGDILDQLKHKVPESMGERRKGLGIEGEVVPEHWERTIAACLEKDPAKRPASAAEVAKRLLAGVRFEKGASLARLAEAGEESPKLKGWPKKKVLAGMMGGLGVALLIGFGIWLFHKGMATQPADSHAPVQTLTSARAPSATLKTPRDSLPLSSKWTGDVLIQFPGEVSRFPVEMLVLEREGTTFKARFEIKGTGEAHHLREIKGTLLGNRIKWLAEDVKVIEGHGGNDSSGSINGDRLVVVSSGPALGEKYRGQSVSSVTTLERESQPTRPSGSAPETAAMPKTKLSPLTLKFENSLGVKFVAVPGTEVLFSIWDTRVQDFEVFVKATGYDADGRMVSFGRNGMKQRGDTWRSPGFAQGPTHPVVGVSWIDAKAFCEWLTEKERRAGKILEIKSYRLPTDAEWSVAVGLPEEFGGSPAEKNGKISGVYPWGTQWPPPSGAGNYAGEEAKDDNWPNGRGVIKGYIDGYARTSPVGTFSANKLGLYDMGGNVWQWCEDWSDAEQARRVIRGASWINFPPKALLSSVRVAEASGHRQDNIGFRVVLAEDSR